MDYLTNKEVLKLYISLSRAKDEGCDFSTQIFLS